MCLNTAIRVSLSRVSFSDGKRWGRASQRGFGYLWLALPLACPTLDNYVENSVLPVNQFMTQ